MAGNHNSGHYTARSLREEARLDLLDAMYEHQCIAEELAHINRRLANGHRLTKLAAHKLDQAFRRELGLPEPAQQVAA